MTPIRLLTITAAMLAWIVGTMPVAAEPTRIVALGTSLTAGYGLAPSEGYVARLEAMLKADGHDVVIENAGVSGDTSAGGLQRLDWALGSKPHFVLLELGANDALRGLEPVETERNLDAILTRLKSLGIRVLFAGMLAPPNLGPEYGAEFNALFPRLAEKHKVSFYPFILEGIAAVPALNQEDGIHPNAEGAAELARRLHPHVSALLSNGRSE